MRFLFFILSFIYCSALHAQNKGLVIVNQTSCHFDAMLSRNSIAGAHHNEIEINGNDTLYWKDVTSLDWDTTGTDAPTEWYSFELYRMPAVYLDKDNQRNNHLIWSSHCAKSIRYSMVKEKSGLVVIIIAPSATPAEPGYEYLGK